MSFDKAKAMRNAERFVAQGKIRAAISEYRSVVDNDPRDIATLNMLGDLYAKNSEKREAINCYLQVAEHYNTQGFAQKAIAVYNKISRIQPDSIEVSAKLAELHKDKGSLSEARSHYTTLAEHYQKNGRRLEALSMYKQIALLDPNNTEVCLNLADSYVREGQKDDAVEAYAEAGARFSRQNKHEEAIRALMKGFDIRATDLRILNGLVKAQTALGRAGKAASLLDEILENEPYNRDVLYLLIECCIDSQNAAGAEKAVVKLVEIEPANYPKFLDLIRIYLNVNDPESAARILTMSAEYLLAGGQAEECGKWISEILERDPAQLSGLRLLVRYNSWLNDSNGFRLALERLYAAAATVSSFEDERFALAQLVVIRPHETRFRDRLNEINAEHGFEESAIDEELLRSQFENAETNGATEWGGGDVSSTTDSAGHYDIAAEYPAGFETNGAATDENTGDHAVGFEMSGGEANGSGALSAADEERIQKEVDSITFYIENDYNDLAEKALAELAQEFGDRPEFAELRRMIGAELNHEKADEIVTAHEISPEELMAHEVTPHEVADEEITAHEVTAHEVADEEVTAHEITDHEVSPEAVMTDEVPAHEIKANTLGINEIRSEFGIEGAEDGQESGDFDTHYHTAVAYQEMGLIEEAIREFQDAINLASPNDGTRRFFQCSNLLGHCFLLNGMANHAITWFGRALETTDISDEENHGLWYELAIAHEASGDEGGAAKYFEKIYAENVDFRDVSQRVKGMVVNH